MVIIGCDLSSSSPDNLKNRISADKIFFMNGYDFYILQMFRNDVLKEMWSLKTVEGVQAINKDMLLPRDFDLSCDEWKRKVLVVLPDSVESLEICLDICDHYQVHGVIIPNFYPEKLTSWFESRPESGLKVFQSVKPSTLSAWIEFTRSNPLILKNVKALLNCYPGDEIFEDEWSTENVGLVRIKNGTLSENLDSILAATKMNLPLIIPVNESLAHCRNVIHHISQNENKTDDDVMKSFENLLQDPLQPLRDNLCAEIYEVFESDPVKYQKYEDAIFSAITDLSKIKSPLRIAVCGAGRGPLVERLFRALERADVYPENVLVLEKSPMAMLSIMGKYEKEWKVSPYHKYIELVMADMRFWQSETGTYDLVITELLGGFGDNELSPECLEGAQRFLSPEGIIIPQQYTSWLEPICSPMITRSLLKSGGGDVFEIPYTVLIANASYFCDPQKAIEFRHPSDQATPRCMSRMLEFNVLKDGYIDGFAGYFTSRLYGNIFISNLRNKETTGMKSWFPVYFPLKSSLKLKANETVSLEFKRFSEEEKAWYSWRVTGHEEWHNHNGAVSFMAKK